MLVWWPSLIEEDHVDLAVDPQGEVDLLGEELANSSCNEVDFDELEELACDEEWDTEQIMALAAAEEERCRALQEEVRAREEEEASHRRDQERQEALQCLKVLRSRQLSLENSLGTDGQRVISAKPQAEVV